MADPLDDWLKDVPESRRGFVREEIRAVIAGEAELAAERRSSPMPKPDPPDPPPPLEMSAAGFARLADYFDHDQTQTTPNERLLAEILEALRGVDDKLERLLKVAGRIAQRLEEGPR